MSIQIDLYTAEPIMAAEFLSWIGENERLSVDEPSLEVMGRGASDGLFWIYGAREGPHSPWTASMRSSVES